MKKIDTLCFSGGGSRAFAIIGVIKKLNELVASGDIELSLKEISGVSAGSIIGCALILGYSIEEIEEEILTKNFNDLKDIKYTSLFSNYGIESGNKFVSWMETIILKKGFNKDITFKELYEKTNICFKVFATNLNKYKYTQFDYINTPDLTITSAIRFSISIPFYFFAKTYENEIHVDGAVINNYPIDIYKNNLSNVLGIKIIDHGEIPEHDVNYNIKSFDNFIYHLIFCMVVNKEKHTTMNEDYKKHTIYIYIKDKKTANFEIPKEEKLKIIDAGVSACEKFFSGVSPWGNRPHTTMKCGVSPPPDDE